MKYGYARVSTREQDLARQIEALKKTGVSEENIIIEKASGKNFIDRAEWQRLMAKVIIGDTIVFKSLDRLGRNKQEIKDTFALLINKGVFLECLDTPIINTREEKDGMNQLISQIFLEIMSFFAQEEREKIKERQSEAYALLKRDEKGRKISNKKIDPRTKKPAVCGRFNKIENLTVSQKGTIKLWIDNKMKIDECIFSTKIGRDTLYRIKKMVKNGTLNIDIN